MNKYDLEDRLINFAVSIIQLSSEVSSTKSGYHLANQLLRSGTSPALNYGESQAAESRKDFIHKLKIVLKELRETFVCLKIVRKAGLFETEHVLLDCLKENNELISIFVKSLLTVERNLKA